MVYVVSVFGKSAVSLVNSGPEIFPLNFSFLYSLAKAFNYGFPFDILNVIPRGVKTQGSGLQLIPDFIFRTAEISNIAVTGSVDKLAAFYHL